ncbi:hypothetical protein P4O66_017532 [Electrophorus voltai]|uniref:Endonuclease/exonuclease/phosphatase domain-containing protein n=1 Tax=Electrophorus voltai TaxID=2609070 RepID=A0AAD8YTL7_9TELE|nr:hypothetical protein P4O66_017532 [Electrophorus voltai]
MVAGGLWNCQPAVQESDFISALASLHFLHFLALTETWITPENSATLAALSSAFSFTHSPRRLGMGGGTGLLNFTPLSFSTLSISSFEFHAITVSFPTKLLIIAIYRSPGSLDHFIDELNILLSQFPIEGNPLILLGDFNLSSEKLHSSCILPLLTAFDLTLSHSPLIHKVGNVLDLIFTRTTTTSTSCMIPINLATNSHILLSEPFVHPRIPLTDRINNIPPEKDRAPAYQTCLTFKRHAYNDRSVAAYHISPSNPLLEDQKVFGSRWWSMRKKLHFILQLKFFSSIAETRLLNMHERGMPCIPIYT